MEGKKCYAYMFEAKGIQRYIFQSGKLRDIVGGSELIARIANGDQANTDAIGSLCNNSNIKVSFSRRAGGAFCAHSESRETLVRLRTLWRFAMLTDYPGLEFIDAIESADKELDAMRACFRAAGGIRNNYVSDVAGLGRPISLIAPLTGRPAVETKTYGDDAVLIDAIGAPQRNFADTKKLTHVAARFVDQVDEVTFPLNFEDDATVDTRASFPFRNADDHRIALVHADLSGLGELFREMGKNFVYPSDNLKLAGDIERAIIAAAKAACKDWVLPYGVENFAESSGESAKSLPARPVLLGGDDITIIVRADIAVPFTKFLLEQIEVHCDGIGKAKGQKALSACAGIAIVGRGTPFLTASALAEDLCNHAKALVKQRSISIDGREGFASALSFHVYQHTALDSYESKIAPNELDAEGNPFSGNPWIVGKRAESFDEEQHRSRADQLLLLASALAGVHGGHNRIREIKSLLSDSNHQARNAWRRWWEIGRQKQTSAMEQFAAALGHANAGVAPELPNGSSGLFDAMMLVDLGTTKLVNPKREAQVDQEAAL